MMDSTKYQVGYFPVDGKYNKWVNKDHIEHPPVWCRDVYKRQVGYFPIKVRTAIVPVCNIGAGFGLPLCVVGCIFAFEPLVYIGLVLFSLATVFQLVTLPVEFNASRRALEFIGSSDLVTKEEYTLSLIHI